MPKNIYFDVYHDAIFKNIVFTILTTMAPSMEMGVVILGQIWVPKFGRPVFMFLWIYIDSLQPVSAWFSKLQLNPVF